eukprot:scaffold375_cov200-Alexandrium_tamarense.AAC.5
MSSSAKVHRLTPRRKVQSGPSSSSAAAAAAASSMGRHASSSAAAANRMPLNRNNNEPSVETHVEHDDGMAALSPSPHNISSSADGASASCSPDNSTPHSHSTQTTMVSSSAASSTILTAAHVKQQRRTMDVDNEAIGDDETSSESSKATTTSSTASSNGDSSDSDSDNAGDVNDNSSSSSSNDPQRKSLLSQIDTSKLSPGHSNIDSLSNYELLRLCNIQRNERKLEKLGLLRITTGVKMKNNGVGRGRKKGSGIGKGGAVGATTMKQQTKQHHTPLQAKTTTTPPKRTTHTLQSQSPYTTPSKRYLLWQNRYSQLQSFHSTHRHFRIPTNVAHHKPLSSWLNRQRKQYALYKEGEKSGLDEERVTLLERLMGVGLGKKKLIAMFGDEGSVGGFGIGGVQYGRSSVSKIRKKRKFKRSGKTGQIWSDGEEEDEEVSIERRMMQDFQEGEGDKDNVDIGSFDSFSESEDEDIYDEVAVRGRNRRDARGGGDRRVKSVSRGNRDYYSDEVSVDRAFLARRGGRSYDYELDDEESFLSDDYPLRSRGRMKMGQRGSRRGRRQLQDSYDTEYTPKPSPYSKGVRQKKSALEQIEAVEEERYIVPDRRSKLSSKERLHSRSLFTRRSEYSDDDSDSPRRLTRTRSANGGKRKRRPGNNLQRSSKRWRREEKSYEHHGIREEVHYESKNRSNTPQPVRKRKHKPMNEIIIAPSQSLTKYQMNKDLQKEHDQLMAEYGRLYGKKCLIVEKKTQLEYELRAMQAIMSGGGVSASKAIETMGGGDMLTLEAAKF